MSEKFCKDCKHVRVEKVLFFIPVYNALAECGRLDDQGPISPVTGKRVLTPRYYCHSERVDWTYRNSCGSEAKYFEAKK